MKNIKGLIAYSGKRYFGFQKTKTGPSIEEELQKGLEQILQHPVTIQAASRTDRGVHAEGQVFNFFLKKEIGLKKLQQGLRSVLPRDISPLHLEEMPPSFHPTLDAKAKEYHYTVCNGPIQLPFHLEFSWHVHPLLDLFSMQEAGLHLLGRRDFSAFSNMKYKDPVRTVEEIRIEQRGENRLVIVIKGDHFLYKMVRNIAGTLIYAGMGKIDPGEIPLILASGRRELAGVTAPAHGLCLKRVFY